MRPMTVHGFRYPRARIVLGAIAALMGFHPSVQGSDGLCAHASDAALIDCYPIKPGFPNATEEACLAQGCCWKAASCVFGTHAPPVESTCSVVPLPSRMACRNPYFSVNITDAATCSSIGCCFDAATTSCYQPAVPHGYDLTSWRETSSGYVGTLRLPAGARGPFGNDIPDLVVDVRFDTDARVRVRILDPSFQRYEVPLALHHMTDRRSAVASPTRLYDVSVTPSPFGLAITRRATGAVLFNSTPTGRFNGLIFENQFLELSTAVPSPPRFFGLGEHVGPLLGAAAGDHYTLWTRDRMADRENAHTDAGGDNVYGVYPFYLRVEDETHDDDHPHHAHGLYLFNSNAIEVVALPHAISLRAVGGILDFFVFLGPSAPAVAAQFTALVGRPMLPPYWSLGYHLCRYHYKSLEQVRGVVHKMRAARMPQDTQWTDIDVLDGYYDFTWNNMSFPAAGVRAFIETDLHAHDQHYIPIVDAGIGVSRAADPAYVDGLAQRVFMTDGSNTSALDINRVWPGDVAYPDFFHPNATRYWQAQLTRYFESAPFDGIWLDMNEPSSFCADSDTHPTSCKLPSKVVRSVDTAFPFDPFRQPYVPGQRHGSGNLGTMTASLAAHQFPSLHYNLHSLYGHSELQTTRVAVDAIRKKRSFVLSRSSFAGDGQYAAHWLGDNLATWEDLRFGLTGVLAMNILGMPMVGPDTCGFNWDTTKELCIRWHQAAILYPFLRNHNAADKDQSPVDFDDETTTILRTTLERRYRLLPYLYTQFFRAHVDGVTVVRSLYFEFPSEATIALDRQYLVGPALLVSPVLDDGARNVMAYFPPKTTWFSLWTGHSLQRRPLAESTRVLLDAPLDTIHVHILGGSIVPLQAKAELTTAATRRNPFRLVVAVNSNGLAKGELYVDAGDSLDPVVRNEYTLVEYMGRSNPNSELWLTSAVVHHGYGGPETDVPMDSILFYGASLDGHLSVTCHRANGSACGGTAIVVQNATLHAVVVSNLNVRVAEAFSVNVKQDQAPTSQRPNVWSADVDDLARQP
ncbi:Aste57867_19631 [Aphanomyces stellatus]|uniref:Aste57867_19631 protein n=1 Tax=Aphanomyces stellatus TaxID=120398 RepID=A0A485LD25_9STRA|nr:hypothetical protein As57867_019566 [Aphanomyces stellatus]VFT96331.1 Aste57867_19631 [Aphanomyces stellatus]